jgi:hypothetical protein
MSKIKLSPKDKIIIEKLYLELVSRHKDESLFRSSEIGNDILTELLLERGFSATEVDEEGYDPLSRAVENMLFEGLVLNENFINVFTMLVEHGSNVQALNSLYEEELNAVQKENLNKVIALLSNIKQADSEKSEEAAEESEEEPAQNDDAEMNDSEENSDSSEHNIGMQNCSNHTINNSLNFTNKEPVILDLTLGLIMNDEDAVPDNSERKAYEKAVAEILAQLENQTAHAADPLEEYRKHDNQDSELFSSSLYPQIPEDYREKIELPFQIFIDPISTINQPFIILGLTLLSGIIGNQYHNNEIADLAVI